MKTTQRMSWIALAAVLWSMPVHAQHRDGNHAAAEAAPGRAVQVEAIGTRKLGWQWANFLVLAGGLGYFAVKKLGPAAAAKRQEILEGIQAGEKARAQAEAVGAELKAKLDHLEVEISELRTHAYEDIKREVQRIDEETLALVHKAQAQTEAEVERMKKAAIDELHAHAAALVIDRAEERLAQRMNATAQTGLVRDFIERIDIERIDGAKGAAL